MRVFEILIDNVRQKKGRFDTDFEPPLQPTTEIYDPSETKPEYWPEAEIEDEDADPPPEWPIRTSQMPEKIMKRNPNYKGEWSPQKIKNPLWFMHSQINNIAGITGIAIDISSANERVSFDNIWLGYEYVDALSFARSTWKVKNDAEMPRMQKKKEVAAAYANAKKVLLDGGMYQFREVVEEYVPESLIRHIPNFIWQYTPHSFFFTVIIIQLSMIWWCMRKSTSAFTELEEDDAIDQSKRN